MNLIEAIKKSKEQGTKLIQRPNRVAIDYENILFCLEDILSYDWELKESQKPKKLLWVHELGYMKYKNCKPTDIDGEWKILDIKELLK